MRIFLYSLSIFCFLPLYGYTQFHYTPNSLVTPAIYKQHDALISVAVCRLGGKEFQVAYSPLPNTVLTYNQMNLPRTSKPVAEWGRGRLQEGGIGAYIGKFPWTCHLLAGYGAGFAENAFGLKSNSNFEYVKSKLVFQQWFVQPGFVIQSNMMRFGLAFRQIWLRYSEGAVDVDDMKIEDLKIIRNIELQSPFNFTEFSLTIGFRIRPFTFSHNSVSIFKKPNYFSQMGFTSSNHNFMLTLDLYELWRWKDTSPRKRKN